MPLGTAPAGTPAIPYPIAAWGYPVTCVCAYTPPETHQELKGPSTYTVQSTEYTFMTLKIQVIRGQITSETTHIQEHNIYTERDSKNLSWNKMRTNSRYDFMALLNISHS
jgi:hypothetical protein